MKLIFIIGMLGFVSVHAAVNLELAITDYNENPSPEQKTFSQTEARLFATPGEYEPFSFRVISKASLADCAIESGALRGPGQAIIPAEEVTVSVVQKFQGGGRDVLVPLKGSLSVTGTEHFWCTIRVPEQVPPGNYEGALIIKAAGAKLAAIRIIVEVLPFQLSDPGFSLGLNYSKPADDPDCRLLEKHFADMRQHGMTSVAPLYQFHQPVYDNDTRELAAVLEAYKKAGFPGVFYWAAPMDLQLSQLAGYGDERSKRWQLKYIEVMRLMHGEVRKHGVPTLFSIGDELTNKGMEGVNIGRRLANFVWEELPEIATTSDMNGYEEVMAMAPYLNVATFNNGWDGADHHNKGRHLLNKSFLEELQSKTGAIPWFVNAGSGRVPFGFFFWKMSKSGVKGKIEWYYNLDNRAGSLVRTEANQIHPTLDYERCREGIDDLKYLCKLEEMMGKFSPEDPDVKKAARLLSQIDANIADDWTLYEGNNGRRFPQDGFAQWDPEKVGIQGKLNMIRYQLAQMIIALKMK